MDGCALTLHAYANFKYGFAQTTIFFQCTPHIDLIIVVPQRSCATLMLRNITENVFRTPFPAVVCFFPFPLSSDSFCVPFGAQTNFSFFLFEMLRTA